MLIRLCLIAGAAVLAAQTTVAQALGLSALPLAILMGIVYGNIARAAPTARGATILAFSQQKLLRVGIILFGFNLTFQQILAVGWQAIMLDATIIILVLGAGIWIGTRVFGMSRELAILTSVGSAICGAAAVMAAEPVVKARERDVSIAVATVVAFGTLAMFCYPLIYPFAGIDEPAFGIYIGSTVHEVAQAAAAGGAIGEEAMRNAVVVKLIRVMLLAPVIITLSTFVFRASGQARGCAWHQIHVPWFVLGFVAVAALNSTAVLPDPLPAVLRGASQLSLAVAMAALGIRTRWCDARDAGKRPLLQAMVLFVLLMVSGYALNIWLYR